MQDLKNRRDRYSSLSGLPIADVYTKDDLKDWDPTRDLGAPGEFPYTRGIYPTMYRGRLWTMRQFAGFGAAEDTNARFKYLLEHGTTGLSVAFDMPTLMGLDSDDPRARGEVGHCGVAVSSLEDMERLFEDIPLNHITTSMTINGPAAVIFAMYLAMAEQRGIPLSQLGGDASKRHTEGVHCPERMALSPKTTSAIDYRYPRVLHGACAEMASYQY